MTNLEKTKDKADTVRSILLVVVTCFGLVGSIFAGYLHIDTKYAEASEVEQLEQRVSLQELFASLRIAQDEYFFLKSQLRKYPDDEELEERVEDARRVVDELKRQIKRLKETTGNQ